ncbi:GAF domain-containing protein [Amycolatopsis sp. NPDC051102]|uniref:helix-turn-helix domain-containing protein n=1 Tax=Amycolatopsis sp. NPDC051102 TaxID=3155163 RepID=UPI003444C0DF
MPAEGPSMLRLLIDDADVGAFDAAVAAARARGASPEELAAAERERAIALQLRDTLLRHRRNEAELQLLNDTANDLASLRDLDSILQAIADRARRLIECDLAYISLSDHGRGDCYIRAAAGNISGLLVGLRLPTGAGLGGMVARTGEPYSLESYVGDTTITHTGPIDRTVAAEGIESLLGVPVKLKQEVIGVLLAAHRAVRSFSSRDITALSMLANHAAVAIENSRLLTAAQTAVEDLRVANATIGSHVDDLERTAEVHERLTKLVIQGKGVEEVVHATAAVVRGHVLVVDEHGTTVATSGEEGEALPAEIAEAGADARRSGHTLVRDRLCVVPMITESEPLGTLVHVGTSPIGDTDRRILERAALVAALVLVTRRRMAEAEARVRGELLGELLSHPAQDYDVLRHRASILGVDLDACRVLVVAHLDGAARERIYPALAALARRFRGLATHHHDTVVLLAPGEDARTVAQAATRELSRATRNRVTAGVACVPHPTAVAGAHEEAAKCMRALIALGRHGETAAAGDLGFVGALFNGHPDVAGFVTATLGPVLHYDSEHRADLLRTLEVFCETGQNARNTAQILHLHHNTVSQRLARVGRLLGDDWRAADRLLEIQVALRLHRVCGR